MTVPKRFDILRFFSGLLKVLAWLSLVFAILAAIGVALAGGGLGQFLGAQADSFGIPLANVGGVGGIVLAVGVLFIGLWYFILFYAMGELLSLNIAVEENTRLTAALLPKMHQDSKVDTRSTYTAGFANEPAPYK